MLKIAIAVLVFAVTSPVYAQQEFVRDLAKEAAILVAAKAEREKLNTKPEPVAGFSPVRSSSPFCVFDSRLRFR